MVRASVNNWIRWYDATGTKSLEPRKAPGAAPKLSEEQRTELVALIEAGPQASGYMGALERAPGECPGELEKRYQGQARIDRQRTLGDWASRRYSGPYGARNAKLDAS